VTDQVPAVPNTQVVDVTGCGNAFCGGFLAGLDTGLSLQDAGVWGCVVGSIMAEAQGVPTANVQLLLPAAADKHQQLLQHMATLSNGKHAGAQLAAAEVCSSMQSSVSAAATAVKARNGACSPWMPTLPLVRCCKIAPRLFLAGSGNRRATKSLNANRSTLAGYSLLRL
jgi:hypothetical protein